MLVQFQFYDEMNKRYEVPVPINKESVGTRNPRYTVEYYGLAGLEGTTFGFKIKRKSTGAVL